MLTVLSTLGPRRLDAGSCIVTSRFRCRSFDRRYVVGALSTGRCLPAVAPRVLIMGDEVRSRSLSPDNHFHGFQVTAPRTTQKSYRPRASHRIMVGTFSQRSACVASGAEWRQAPLFHETVELGQATGVGIASGMRGDPKRPRPKPPKKGEGAGCKSPDPRLLWEEGENFFLDILSHRTTYKTRVALENPCKKR